jgi:methyl-accepting chemotaxis protein
MTWTNLTLRTKLLLAFGSLAALTATSCFIALTFFSSVEEDVRYLQSETVPTIETTDDIIMSGWEALSVVQQYDTRSEASADLPALRDEFENLIGQTQSAIDELERVSEDERIVEKIDDARTDARDLEAAARATMEAHRAGKADEAARHMKAATDRMEGLAALLDEIVARADQLGEEAEAEAVAETRRAQQVLWGLLAAGVFVALALGWLVSGRISRPVHALAAAADRVADGDTDVEVEARSNDEIGRLGTAFNAMVERIRAFRADLRQKEEAVTAQKEYLSRKVREMLDAMERFAEGDLTVEVHAERGGEIAELFDGFNEAVAAQRRTLQQVRQAAGTTAAASRQIGAASDQLAASAEEQSAQTREVAAAMEEMNRTIVQNAESTQKTATAAEIGGEEARTGGTVIEETVGKMQEIAEVVADSAQNIERLGASSEQIGSIVETIDEIADQTNLLALNAAIEAARAGEHGSGFAVVAEEVRELAERTSEATDEIAQMIEEVQAETSAAVEAMEAGQARVDEGLELADRTDEALDRIITSTDRVERQIGEIAAASEQQSATSEQISRNVQSIATASEQAAVAVTQVSESTRELRGQTETLDTLVRRFQIDDDGAGTRATGEAPVGGDGKSAPSSPAVPVLADAEPPMQPQTPSAGAQSA